MRSSKSPLKHHRELRQKRNEGESTARSEEGRMEGISPATDGPYIQCMFPCFLQGPNISACNTTIMRVMINRTEAALYRNTCPLHVSYRHRLPVWTESFRGRRERGARLGRIMMMEEKPPLHPLTLSEKQLHSTSASLCPLDSLNEANPRKPATAV